MYSSMAHMGVLVAVLAVSALATAEAGQTYHVAGTDPMAGDTNAGTRANGDTET